MNKYLIARTKGKLVNEVEHLKRDYNIPDNRLGKSTVPWIIRKIKRIKSKQDMMNYHSANIEKIINSKYFIVTDDVRVDIQILIDMCNNMCDDIVFTSNVVLKKIRTNIFLSVYYGQLNALEYVVIIAVLAILMYFL